MNTEIDKALERIFSNICQYSFSRFDPVDIRNCKFKSKYTRFFFLFLEEFFPLLLRKCFKIEKVKFPTAYTHVAEALLILEQNELNTFQFSAKELCEEGLSLFLQNSNGNYYWPYKENDYFFLRKENNGQQPTMHLHGLARFNILLLKLGKYLNNQKYIDIACLSAIETMKRHTVNTNENKEWFISYYYNSLDCTLNVNTEYAQWLSMIPDSMQNNDFNVAINGIVRLMLHEQNEDGSWYYYSKKFMGNYKLASSVDCHHTGTVLSNLIYVSNSPWVEDNLRKMLKKSIDKGMVYYINNFFDLENGQAKEAIGHRRYAGPVQYSEAIFAFYNYLFGRDINQQLRTEILHLFPKVMSQIIRLIKRDGSAPSEHIIRWKNLNSIRWGNGPALQALACCKVLQEKGIIDK